MSLTDLLDDLARAQAVPVRADLAWTDGRRGRRRSRVRVLVAAAAALGLLALAVPGLPEPVSTFARSSGNVVDGHPERIGRQWWVRDLPERPGPVAALMQSPGPDRITWYAVRSDGHRWRLPEVSHRSDLWPALSDDGRLLGYLEQQSGPYVVRDLVTGERTEFPGIVEPAGADLERGILYGQSPAFFSPDGTRLLLPAGAAVLDLPRRSVTLLRAREPQASTLGMPAGWAGDDRIVWLHGGGDGSLGSAAPLRARTTDLAGTTLDDVELAGTSGALPDQWAGTTSPDGSQLAVTTGSAFSAAPLGVTRYALRDGSSLGSRVPADVHQPCATTWSATSLVVPVLPPESAVLAQDVADGSRTTVTVAAPQLGARCLVWAAEGLDGPTRGGGLIGTSEVGWTWWWRELALAAVLAVLAAVGAVRATARVWRLPRAERPSSARPEADWYS